RVRALVAHARGRTAITLRFRAPGTDGGRPPAATRYAIVQSRTSPRRRTPGRASRRTGLLCGGACRFAVRQVGTQITLTVRKLRPGTTYRYTVTALDNVSGRHGRGAARATVRTLPRARRASAST
ncbi:MAG: fibronectin type III domain-containing protein, partial [Solirubrobacteraceae bacterium]